MKIILGITLCVIFCVFSVFLFPETSFAGTCGNAKLEPGEECDTGTAINDFVPDACRSGCKNARCGDGVVDSNEQCDDGLLYASEKYNSDKIPDFCRLNCMKPKCGDGVMDISAGEECDDNNNDAYDGCYRCEKCYAPKDGLILEKGLRVRLCAGRYEMDDINKDGAVIIRGEGMHVDCSDAIILGNGSASSDSKTSDENSGIVSIINYVGKLFSSAYAAVVLPNKTPISPTTTTNTRTTTTTPTTSPQTAKTPTVLPSAITPQTSTPTAPVKTPSQQTITPSSIAQTGTQSLGTGISIEAADVVLNNCHIENFAIGIEIKSTNALLFDNIVCGNNRDIVSQHTNYGIRNTCTTTDNWQETPQTSGCMNKCP